MLNLVELLPDCIRAHLLVVTNDYYLGSHVECYERHHIALAGLIDDDHIHSRFAWIEVLDSACEGHDPHGY
jgi:hypothetical protein